MRRGTLGRHRRPRDSRPRRRRPPPRPPSRSPRSRVRVHPAVVFACCGYKHRCGRSVPGGSTLLSRRSKTPVPRSDQHHPMSTTVEQRERVVVRFAGDSGDGMQLTGDRFTNATALLGNDLATLPDFPAEIRAPAGTVHGVSAFQIQFASNEILTPGDHPSVLVAMNPAALKANLESLERGGTVIINEDAFIPRNIEKAGYDSNPLQDGTLDGYQVFQVPMTTITVRATGELDISKKEAERAKNMFALGLICWMYGRPTEVTFKWLHKKFADKPVVLEANLAAF